MKTPLNVLTSLFILLFFGGCDKGPDLTPITQEGKNTFSCKVNGKVWVPDGTSNLGGTSKPIYGVFYLNTLNDSVYVNIQTNFSDGTRVELFLRKFEVGLHYLNQNTARTGSSFYPQSYGYYFSGQKEYITSKVHVGSITILKSDISSGILSGTFEFSASTMSGETVLVSEGRFDLNHKTL